MLLSDTKKSQSNHSLVSQNRILERIENMKTEDIVDMAEQAGLCDPRGLVHAYDQLEKFAKLVASAERDACLNIAERSMFVSENEDRNFGYRKACIKISRAIRLRWLYGKQKSI
jgi:hypothetical protein